MAQANVDHDYSYGMGSLCSYASKEWKKPVTNVWQKLTKQFKTKSNQNFTGMLKASYLKKDWFHGKYWFPTEATWRVQKMLRCQKSFSYLGRRLFIFTVLELKSAFGLKSSKTQPNSTLSQKEKRKPQTPTMENFSLKENEGLRKLGVY